MLVTKTITKKGLEFLIENTFANFGNIYTANLLDSLKFLGFHYATCSGLSITIDDLKTPKEKKEILKETRFKILKTNQDWYSGKISENERFQTIINAWNDAGESLKNRIVDYYKNFAPGNNLYVMAFSGARGNISQIRQLVGMRGLMADQSGNIISLPITANFREGLGAIDYIISSYGARKGIVDTALKTADSGYLTRRLIYLARNVLIKHYDCETTNGILLFLTKKSKVQNLLGKIIISENIFDFSNQGKIIDETLFNSLKRKNRFNKFKYLSKNTFMLKVRSPITCNFQKSICQSCYGWDLSKRKLISMGDTVGIAAAQAIGEPGTQLTMRTFHTGGIFTNDLVVQKRAPFSGKLCLPKDLKMISYKNSEGKIVLKLLENLSIKLVHWTGKRQKISLDVGSFIYFNSSQYIRKHDIISESIERNISSLKTKGKPLYSNFEGQITCLDSLTLSKNQKNQIKKNGIAWLQSAKSYKLPFDILYSYPKILHLNKSLGFLKLVSPITGLLKKTRDLIIIQARDLKIKNKKIKLVKKYLKLYYERLFYNYFSKLNYINKNKVTNCFFKNNFFYITSKSEKFQNNLNHNPIKIGKKNILIKKYFLFFYLNLTNIFYFKKSNEYLKKEGAKLNLPLYSFSKFDENIDQKINISVKNTQYLDSYSILGKMFFYPLNLGKIYGLKVKKDLEEDFINFFFITRKDIWRYYSDQFSNTFLLFDFKKKNFIQKGSFFSPTCKSLNSGILIDNDGFRFIFQSAQPIFLPASTKINFQKDEVVKKNVLLATLVTSNQQTEDIVQGLPKIEKLLEGHSKQKATSMYAGIFINEQKIKDTTYLKNRKVDELGYQVSLVSSDTEDDTNILENNFYILDNNFFSQRDKKEEIKDENEDYYGVIFESFTSLKSIFLFENSLYSLFPVYSSIEKDEKEKDEKIRKSLCFYKKNGKICKKQVLYEPGTKIIHILTTNNTFISFYLNSLNNIHKNYYSSIAKLHLEFVDLLEQLNIGELSRSGLLSNLSFFHHRRLGVKEGNIKAAQQFQLIFSNSIQAIYSAQGVRINSKHLEIIAREMISRGRILKSGNTPFFLTERVPLSLLNIIYDRLEDFDNFDSNFEGPLYEPILESMTNSALRKEGFLSNAGFQQTKQILTKSALLGKIDWIDGLKESIITGRLISAGSIFFNSKAYLDTIFKIQNKTKIKKKINVDLNFKITKEIKKIEKLNNFFKEKTK
jgi:hypothetical protein